MKHEQGYPDVEFNQTVKDLMAQMPKLRQLNLQMNVDIKHFNRKSKVIFTLGFPVQLRLLQVAIPGIPIYARVADHSD